MTIGSMPETMRAVAFVEPNKVEVVERPTPKIEAESDIILKTITAGLCGESPSVPKRGVSVPFFPFSSLPSHLLFKMFGGLGGHRSLRPAGSDAPLEPLLRLCGLRQLWARAAHSRSWLGLHTGESAPRCPAIALIWPGSEAHRGAPMRCRPDSAHHLLIFRTMTRSAKLCSMQLSAHATDGT